MLNLNEIRMIDDYIHGDSIETLRKRYKRASKTIQTILTEAGIELRSHREASILSAKSKRILIEEDIIFRYISGESLNEISLDLGVGASTVRQVFVRNGLTLRSRNGPHHPSWRGGTRTLSGYKLILISEEDKNFESMSHNNTDGAGYVMEHRLVMAKSIGRPLEAQETVHHINGDRLDNRIENLQLRSSNHGQGQVSYCGDCGSNNILFKELE